MTGAPQRIRLIMELRRNGVTDPDVLAAVERVPRERFVPEAFQDKAYENTALPIGGGQTISQPSVVARMTQELRLGRRMKVLEIGTGSGYQAAVLSRLCRRLYTIEHDPGLLALAEPRLRELRYNNIVTRRGDGRLGWPEQGEFDRIMVTACGESVPDALTGQLAPGGILVMPVGPESGEQRIVRVTRGENGLEFEDLWAVRFVSLYSEGAGVDRKH